jgi:hypothetical protein
MADPLLGGPPPLVSAPEDNEGSRILTATIATTALAFVTVVMRLFVRLGMIRNFGWDVSIRTLIVADDKVADDNRTPR